MTLEKVGGRHIVNKRDIEKCFLSVLLIIIFCARGFAFTNTGLIPTAYSQRKASRSARIQPSDLTYQGAFRLPDCPDTPENVGWEWSSWCAAMAYYPDGNPDGPDDGYPGSIFGIGHDHSQYVSEINIPVPVNSASKNLSELNTAETLQSFHDIQAGLFGSMELPRVGLAYLPAQGSQTSGKLYFAWAPHMGEAATDPSHGWCDLNLSNPQSVGVWRIGSYWNYVTGDYLFPIPQTWADAYTPNKYLVTGRFRDGGQGAEGPSIFAIGPWNDGNPPANGSTLSVTPLLLYGNAYEDNPITMTNYQHSDEWNGGAWLTAGNNSAVIFVGTKGQGNCWYGCADGTDAPPWPDEDRGWWSDRFIGQIIFYDPADLAAVAQGEMETYQPQPYAFMEIDDYLYHIGSQQQKYHVSTAGFDRERGFLYVFEPGVDSDKPIVHVWKVSGSSGLSAPANVSATHGLYTNKVQITWNAVADATSYEVWRNTINNAEGGTLIATSPLRCKPAACECKRVTRWPLGDSQPLPDGSEWHGVADVAEVSETSHDDTTVSQGTVYYYWVKAKNSTSTSGFSDPDTGYAVAEGTVCQVINDFDGDGKTDIAVYHETTGYWYILLSGSSYSLSYQKFGETGYDPVPGDFDGDRKADLTVFNETTGWWYYILSSTYTLGYTKLGETGYVPVPADFDGDNKTDLAVYNETTGWWYYIFSSSSSLGYTKLGETGYAPVPADYDGDGKADLAVYNEMTGWWYYILSSSGSLGYTKLGESGYAPVPANYDGDGKADLAVYNETTGWWYYILSSSGSLGYTKLGESGYVPVPGDYDGDGTTDLAVYHEPSGYWYILLSGSSYSLSYQKFGETGYKPIK